MAQQMIERMKKSTFTQTGDSNEFILAKNKTVKLYYSNVYRENVVALTLSSTKSFIFSESLWEKFKLLIPIIDNYFENES
jgi:hypothetical protein